MDALKKSIAGEAVPKGKKPRTASAGQKEMLLPIEGKKARSEKSGQAGADNRATEGRIDQLGSLRVVGWGLPAASQ
jgi:hypothetical protein